MIIHHDIHDDQDVLVHKSSSEAALYQFVLEQIYPSQVLMEFL